MLLSLITLSDEDIDVVTSAVSRWCSENRCAVDSEKGRRALMLAIDLIQVSDARDDFADRLACKLDAGDIMPGADQHPQHPGE